MKWHRGILVLLAVVFYSIFASTVLPAEDNREADHAALRALRDRVATAIDQQDIKTLASSFTKEFIFTSVNQTPVTSETQMQALFDEMFHSPKAILRSLKTDPQADILTRFIDTNTGICYGSSRDTYTLRSGEVVQMNVRWTATVVKENGQWKIATAHVGTDFLNNPVIDRVSSLWKRIAVGTGLGGLLLGVLFGVIFFRRRTPVAA